MEHHNVKLISSKDIIADSLSKAAPHQSVKNLQDKCLTALFPTTKEGSSEDNRFSELDHLFSSLAQKLKLQDLKILLDQDHLQDRLHLASILLKVKYSQPPPSSRISLI
ncbi:hypothetical protein PCASD_08821 [Puccinia coronata f. sp. avenae]|uniref:Uncharacterized protein n=1 Tax=Puccinia coronata f. sp. avenae TaxID=200324 RepID=A0A2N5USB9_9BASI|nr:hypothetical protein PCASD_08821 [Puccinia coronata f. sp. avenae]